MRKEIRYDTDTDYETKRINNAVLCAYIENMKKPAEVKAAIDELESLGFTVTDISDGDVKGIKFGASPRDIADPKYAGFRFTARLCDD